MKEPIKVLYVSNIAKIAAGASRSIFSLISNLDKEKVQPFFASIYQDELAKEIMQLGVVFHKLKTGYLLHPLLSIASFSGLVDFIKEYSIDLIHNNQCGDAYYSWLPAKFTQTPLIIHHRDPSFYKSSKFLMNRAQANIAISSWQNEHNLNNKGVVIHNSIELDKYSMENKSKRLISYNGNLKVGLLGRLAPYKGQDVFIKAAALVLKQAPDVKFFIIGDDQNSSYKGYIDSLKSLVSELGLQDDVIFTGYVPGGWEILPELDISVVPSRVEPFGRVIIESMACGKPVIATNVWGALDIVTPETGILVAPGDPEALAEAMMKLINSPEKRLSMGIAGRRRAEEFFSVDLMMNRIYTLYYDVLSR